MRWFALVALLGSFTTSNKLAGQSLAEHAATVSGATIGTAAGKPIGTALGKMFGSVDQSASKTAATKAAKPPHPPEVTGHGPGSLPPVSIVVPDAAPGGGGAFTRRSPHHAEVSASPRPAAPSMAPVFAAPFIREPSVRDVAGIQVGATDRDLHEALGAPESRVSIPDDGHLIEICQYWAHGEQLGTIRLDNGYVVSVQTRN